MNKLGKDEVFARSLYLTRIGVYFCSFCMIDQREQVSTRQPSGVFDRIDSFSFVLHRIWCHFHVHGFSNYQHE